MPLQTSDILSIVAIVVSIASFAVAAYAVFLDRPRLRVSAKFYDESEHGPACIRLSLVNLGRRPVIVTLIGGTDANGAWSGEYLAYEKGGHRLAEHERHERTVRKEDTITFTPDDEAIVYAKLWVEDSLGNRHPVPKSEEYLRKLWQKTAP